MLEGGEGQEVQAPAGKITGVRSAAKVGSGETSSSAEQIPGSARRLVSRMCLAADAVVVDTDSQDIGVQWSENSNADDFSRT